MAKLMVSSFMPPAMRNLDLNDKNTWKKIKVFSNKQPQNLRNEIKTYKNQLREDKGQSFIVSYKNKNQFERRLNQGESFLWVFTIDQDLIIGSKKKPTPGSRPSERCIQCRRGCEASRCNRYI